MDTLIAHINALLRSSLGTLTNRACGASGFLQARNAQDALQIRQRAPWLRHRLRPQSRLLLRTELAHDGIAQLASIVPKTRNTILGSATKRWWDS
jgi:hypothetical protein